MSLLSQLRWIFSGPSDEEFALSELRRAVLRHVPREDEIRAARSLVVTANFISEIQALSFEEAFGRLLITVARRQEHRANPEIVDPLLSHPWLKDAAERGHGGDPENSP